jgi:adenylyl-sulfate kinase
VSTPFTIWCTGLPSSGSSALADTIAERLHALRIPVEVLNSGRARRSQDGTPLGFTKDDRDSNVRRHGEAAARLVQDGIIAVVSAVSPYAEARAAVRETLGAFFEVYVSTPKPACIDQCTSGNWIKALNGDVRNFTGVDHPYESPSSPDVEIDLSVLAVDEGVEKLMVALRAHGYLSESPDPHAC